jgi:hypothetical protein
MVYLVLVKIMTHLFVVVVAVLFVGCAHHEVAEREVPPNKAFLFKSKNELNATEREALAGDNAAAKRMADYYYFTKNDRGNCIWWLKLAASRGDAAAKENLKKIQQEQQ